MPLLWRRVRILLGVLGSVSVCACLKERSTQDKHPNGYGARRELLVFIVHISREAPDFHARRVHAFASGSREAFGVRNYCINWFVVDFFRWAAVFCMERGETAEFHVSTAVCRSPAKILWSYFD